MFSFVSLIVSLIVTLIVSQLVSLLVSSLVSLLVSSLVSFLVSLLACLLVYLLVYLLVSYVSVEFFFSPDNIIFAFWLMFLAFKLPFLPLFHRKKNFLTRIKQPIKQRIAHYCHYLNASGQTSGLTT